MSISYVYQWLKDEHIFILFFINCSINLANTSIRLGWPEGGVSQYRRYFLFRTIRVEYSFESSLMMLRKDETVGTYATGGIASLRSKWTGPGISKMYV